MKGPALKIGVLGPYGAGKTTLVGTLSTTPVVSTEAPSSEGGKATTTVALDYGYLDLGSLGIHLFGTPGQPRFLDVLDVALQGALGALILVRADQPSQLPRARELRDYVTSVLGVPYLLGVTHMDKERRWEPREIALFMREPKERVLPVDPRDRDQAHRVLVRLVELACEEGGRCG